MKVFWKKKLNEIGYIFIYDNQFLGEQLKSMVISYAFLFEILPKFSDFVNSDDYFGKITLKSIRLQPIFIQKKI